MQPRVLVIVGVGLIGGSIGFAVRRNGGMRVLGLDDDAAALLRAKENGIVDEVCTDLGAAAFAADLMLFCTPVDRIADKVLAAAPACRPGTVLSDVGSTKVGILSRLHGRLPSDVQFVGGHPLAGSEKQGSSSADANLFRGRLVILTPTTPETDIGAVTAVSSFWERIGARVLRMSPEAHDHAMALTSHLPHLIASALAGLLPPELTSLTANGFRDTTRVASGDPRLWTAILEANRDEILSALSGFEDRVREFRTALETADHDRLQFLLQAGRERRSAIANDT
jgi:cyclohexadieny/prephenate dehydrogenase